MLDLKCEATAALISVRKHTVCVLARSSQRWNVMETAATLVVVAETAATLAVTPGRYARPAAQRAGYAAYRAAGGLESEAGFASLLSDAAVAAARSDRVAAPRAPAAPAAPIHHHRTHRCADCGGADSLRCECVR
jgi:hypothetical protein